MSEAVTYLEDYDTETRFRAEVISSERITPEASDEEVREIVLDVDRPGFAYEVGQSIGVLAPGERFGKEFHFRLYSVADLPEVGRPRPAAHSHRGAGAVATSTTTAARSTPGSRRTSSATCVPATPSRSRVPSACLSTCRRRRTRT